MRLFCQHSFFRFCPHLLLDSRFPEVKAEHIIDVVNQGLRRGEEKFGVKVRVTLIIYDCR